MKKLVFTFGRMNPPTIGHEKLANKIKSVAKQENADARIYLSHTQNPTKDPLSYKQKLTFAKKAFGIAHQSNAKQIFQILKEIYADKYTDIVMVVGSDRVKEFSTLLNKYNGKGDYEFDSIKVVSAGERDPDAQGVEGMSGTKLRAIAKAGDFDTFKQAAASKLSDRDKKKMMDMVQKALKEDLDEAEWTDEDTALYEELEQLELIEVRILTTKQRLDKARLMKKLAPKIARIRKIKAKRQAGADVLQKRVKKQATQIVRTKVAGEKGIRYKELSPGEKMSVDKLVAKKSAAIEKIAKKLLPKAKKAEQERVKAARMANNPTGRNTPGQKTEDFDALVESAIKTIKVGESAVGAKETQYALVNKERKIIAVGLKDEMTKLAEKEGGRVWKISAENNVGDLVEGVAQDKDIDDKSGTQPAKYYKGLAKSTKDKRDAQFKKQAKMDDDNPAAYKPAPGDADAKTKPSKYTKKYRQMFGEEQLDEKIEGLEKKAEKSGISYGILKKVYDRGMAAWRTGHRPGTTPQQWAFARVNSFITGGKTRTTADADLWKQHRGKSESVELEEARAKQAVSGGKVQKLVTAHGLKFKGKAYKEIDMELKSIDNNTQMVTFNIIHPKEIFGNEVKVPFKTLRRGPFMATDTSKINNEAVSPAQQAAIAIAKKKSGKYDKDGKRIDEAEGKYEKIGGKTYYAVVNKAGKKKLFSGPTPAAKKYAKTNEAYEIGTDEYANHTKEMTPGQTEGLKTHPKLKNLKIPTGATARRVKDAESKSKARKERRKGTALAAAYNPDDDFGGKPVKKFKDIKKKSPISEAIQYHLDTGVPFADNIFRHDSPSFYRFFQEARVRWRNGELEPDATDKQILMTDIGLFGIYEGKEVPLDCPLMEADKDVELNSPKRGGSKKFYVYVKNDKGNVVKVEFGDTSGLKAKINDREAARNFASRHQCDTKNDKTKPGYWACRLPWYAKSLGLEGGGKYFW